LVVSAQAKTRCCGAPAIIAEVKEDLKYGLFGSGLNVILIAWLLPINDASGAVAAVNTS
jgi:hypothetical protein